MNKEQKQMWKKLADDRMQIAIDLICHIPPGPARRAIVEYRENYDKSYKLVGASILIDPTTSEPFLMLHVKKDGKIEKHQLAFV